MNPPEVFPWGDSRPFYSQKTYFLKKFGGRVQKLSVDGGFTCPNRDGTKGYGGCTYCNNEAFNPSYCSPRKSISQQLEEGRQFHAWRYRRAVSYLAYFQAYSNTYASLGRLRALYEEALSVEGVIGLVISTRADCVDDALLDYLARLAEKYYVHLEYGIESCYDETLRRINRGHGFEEVVKAIEATAARGIPTGGHLIFGLPGETREMMMQSAEIISSLPLTSLKLHQLQIIRGTVMEARFRKHPEEFELFGRDEYIDFVVRYTSRLPSGLVIERFTAEAPPRLVVAPDWGFERADELQRSIERRFRELNIWQGKEFSPVH